MDSSIKYPKHSSIKFSMKPKTRSIGINTEEDYPNLNCPKCSQGNGDLKYVVVPCLPYYQMCSGNILHGPTLNASEKLNSSTSVSCKCDKSVHILHCCPSVNCTNCDSNIKGICTLSSSDSSRENTSIKKLSNCTLQTQVPNDSNQLNTRLATNELFYSPFSKNIKEEISEKDITRYANEILGTKAEDRINNEHSKRQLHEETQLLTTLLTPNNGTNKYDTETLIHDESDDCNESDNDEEMGSVEEEEFKPKVILTARKGCVNSAVEPAQEALNNGSKSMDISRPSLLNVGSKTGKPATAGGTNAEMLMMLKALVGQKGENCRLNQLLTQIGTENSTQKSEHKKTVTGMPRKKIPYTDCQK